LVLAVVSRSVLYRSFLGSLQTTDLVDRMDYLGEKSRASATVSKISEATGDIIDVSMAGMAVGFGWLKRTD